MTNPGRSENKLSNGVPALLAKPWKGADHLSERGAECSPVADLSSVADYSCYLTIAEGYRNLAVGEEIPRPAILLTKDTFSQFGGVPAKVAVASGQETSEKIAHRQTALLSGRAHRAPRVTLLRGER